MQIIRTLLSLALAVVLVAHTALGEGLTAVPDGLQAELSLPDLHGEQRSLVEFRGQVVLLSFWASWCTPCIQEMPSIQRLQQRLHGRPFAVLGVNVGERERRVQTVARQLGLDFPVLLDRDSSEFKRWGGEVLPTSYVLDSAGAARFVALGPLDWDAADVVDTLKALLPPSPGVRAAQR
ncbi:MAG: TlpA family protein disulfide reductase [Chromatiaceae bacterium]|nr:TlpA family protein disulfide reductase [Chromatiaceae bacterium]